MQHAMINAMKCMRAIKDRIARPVYQLAHHLSQPLYPHSVSIGEIIGTTQQLASHNVAFNQVINQSVNQARDKHISRFHNINLRKSATVNSSYRGIRRMEIRDIEHDPTVGQSQRGTQSGYQIKSINQAQDSTADLTAYEQIPPSLKITRPKTSSNKSVQGKVCTAQPTARNSAASRSCLSSKQPPRLVGKERCFQEVSNATKNSNNGDRNQREITIESDGEQ
ncbi:glycosyltransferase family 28 protein Monogalactosyldiacylglycerol (MGDG) synthase [Dorcoceras hygrometricum]|uniref:Glycosyltransferase family 28 protein Monogalactosyldiacylglycerol (MGDG) synthase n=1 Tax=Dorcoceras hygrometricum TaxID=472368 RepID=A0A2Z7BFV3_9LAMI|nr:glycosyltransferase family 28 protein Monogalactosyldiacylglycerol (MGDG) synthase [Dorcoceras hygrometricum]